VRICLRPRRRSRRAIERSPEARLHTGCLLGADAGGVYGVRRCAGKPGRHDFVRDPDPDPGITLALGDRVNLLAREPRDAQPAQPTASPPATQTATLQMRRQPHQRRLPHPAGSPRVPHADRNTAVRSE